MAPPPPLGAVPGGLAVPPPPIGGPAVAAAVAGAAGGIPIPPGPQFDLVGGTFYRASVDNDGCNPVALAIDKEVMARNGIRLAIPGATARDYRDALISYNHLDPIKIYDMNSGPRDFDSWKDAWRYQVSKAASGVHPSSIQTKCFMELKRSLSDNTWHWVQNCQALDGLREDPDAILTALQTHAHDNANVASMLLKATTMRAGESSNHTEVNATVASIVTLTTLVEADTLTVSTSGSSSSRTEKTKNSVCAWLENGARSTIMSSSDSSTISTRLARSHPASTRLVKPTLFLRTLETRSATGRKGRARVSRSSLVVDHLPAKKDQARIPEAVPSPPDQDLPTGRFASTVEAHDILVRIALPMERLVGDASDKVTWPSSARPRHHL